MAMKLSVPAVSSNSTPICWFSYSIVVEYTASIVGMYSSEKRSSR